MIETGYLVGGGFCGLFLSTVGFVIGNMKGESNKRGELYRHIEEKYVTKELHNEKIETLSEDVKEIKQDVKNLLSR